MNQGRSKPLAIGPAAAQVKQNSGNGSSVKTEQPAQGSLKSENCVTNGGGATAGATCYLSAVDWMIEMSIKHPDCYRVFLAGQTNRCEKKGNSNSQPWAGSKRKPKRLVKPFPESSDMPRMVDNLRWKHVKVDSWSYEVAVRKDDIKKRGSAAQKVAIREYWNKYWKMMDQKAHMAMETKKKGRKIKRRAKLMKKALLFRALKDSNVSSITMRLVEKVKKMTDTEATDMLGRTDESVQRLHGALVSKKSKIKLCPDAEFGVSSNVDIITGGEEKCFNRRNDYESGGS